MHLALGFPICGARTSLGCDVSFQGAIKRELMNTTIGLEVYFHLRSWKLHMFYSDLRTVFFSWALFRKTPV